MLLFVGKNNSCPKINSNAEKRNFIKTDLLTIAKYYTLGKHLRLCCLWVQFSGGFCCYYTALAIAIYFFNN